MALNRIVVYPKDIVLITGKSERHSRVILNNIKKHFHKEPRQHITIKELCAYMGITEDEVKALIFNRI